MDIKLPFDVGLPLAAKTTANTLSLKLNQVLEARVIDNQIALDTLTLSVADKTIRVQSQQPLNLESGQPLRLQVIKLLPTLEFKILPNPSPASSQATLTASSEAAALKLLGVLPPLSASSKPALNQLPAGHTLQAVIVDVNGKKITLQLLPASSATSQPGPAPLSPQPPRPTITLDVGQLQLPPGKNDDTPSASKFTPLSPNTLKPGTLINLQVLKPGDAPTFSLGAPATNTEQKIIELFKQLLPIQTASAPLLNQLAQMMPVLDGNPTVAETLKQLAQEILNATPSNTQLTEPSRLKQSLDQSGLFFEHKLAELLSGKDGASLQLDMKLKLLKLVALLNLEIEAKTEQSRSLAAGKLLEEMLQKTHGTLARLTLDQFQSIPRDDSPKHGWVLELPFFRDHQADSAHIEIELDKQTAQGEHKKNWAVSITITPPNLATIHCRISCYDGSINTRFWSDTLETVEKINTHLDYLKLQFEQNGLTTGFMEAHQGKPTKTDSETKPLSPLLSEKA